jgi:hypothetical protein
VTPHERGKGLLIPVRGELPQQLAIAGQGRLLSADQPFQVFEDRTQGARHARDLVKTASLSCNAWPGRDKSKKGSTFGVRRFPAAFLSFLWVAAQLTHV